MSRGPHPARWRGHVSRARHSRVRLLLADRKAAVDDAFAFARCGRPVLAPRRPPRSFSTFVAAAVVTADLDAFIAAGVIAALAIERAYPPLFRAHRIQRVHARKRPVEFRPG